MISNPKQIEHIARQFLDEKNIKFTKIENASFYTKDKEGIKHPNDYWVVPYTYTVFQEEGAFVHVDDAKQEVIYILTNHGYIHPNEEKNVAVDDEEDWDDL